MSKVKEIGIRDCKQKRQRRRIRCEIALTLYRPPRRHHQGPASIPILPKHNLSIRATPALFGERILAGSASHRTQTGTSSTAQIATSCLAQSLAHRLHRELSMGSSMRSSRATNGNAAGRTLICGERGRSLLWLWLWCWVCSGREVAFEEEGWR